MWGARPGTPAVLAGGGPVPQRAGAARGAEGDGPACGDGPGDPGRAGDGPGGLIDGEVVQGEPAVDGRRERPGLDHRGVPGLAQRGTQVPGAVGGSPLTSASAASRQASRVPTDLKTEVRVAQRLKSSQAGHPPSAPP